MVDSKHLFGRELSPREMEIVTLRVQGYSHDECADMLGLASSSVRSRISRVYAKLGIKDIHQLSIWYFGRPLEAVKEQITRKIRLIKMRQSMPGSIPHKQEKAALDALTWTLGLLTEQTELLGGHNK